MVVGVGLCLFAAAARADVAVTATQGRAALMDYTIPSAADTVQDSSRLRTRASTNTNYKSWVQFDLNAAYAADPNLKGHVVDATLTLFGDPGNPSGKSVVTNGLNDSASLEGWTSSSLTWNNAPGNNTTSQSYLNTSLTTAKLATVDVAVGDGAATAVSSTELTAFVNADTDGKVTFILTPGSTAAFYNVGTAYPPTLTLSKVSKPPKTLFVSTTGSDTTGNGTISLPYGTIGKAVGLAAAGDTIYLRAGTYTYFGSSTAITLPSRSGAGPANRIFLMGYNGERPLMDFSAMTGTSATGLSIVGDYWYVKGMDFKQAPGNGVRISGSYNTLEFCTAFQCTGAGMHIGGGGVYNRIINCDAYRNYDPQNQGGNADGFSASLDVGTGSYFYGCRSWDNSDDGYDGYLRPADDVTTTYENCWASRNGWSWIDGSTTDAMNGNGFKMGGCDAVNGQKLLRHNVVLRNCLAFSNKVRGFDQNSNKGSMNLYNCTAFGNGGSNYGITTSPLADGKTATVTNSVNYSGTVSLGSFVVQTTNSWQSPFTVTAADFVSTDPAAAYGPRNADGSLPQITFMHLAAGSDLIDGGTNVGLPYLGAGPDLGCFESGCTARITADLNGNCQTDFLDFAILAGGWTSGLPSPDLNGDNALGWLDVLEFSQDWLVCNRTPASQCWQ